MFVLLKTQSGDSTVSARLIECFIPGVVVGGGNVVVGGAGVPVKSLHTGISYSNSKCYSSASENFKVTSHQLVSTSEQSRLMVSSLYTCNVKCSCHFYNLLWKGSPTASIVLNIEWV